MTRNEGNLDRFIRLVAGIALGIGAVAVGLGSALGIVLAVLGVVMLFTAATGFCALYKVFGFSTCSTTPSTRESAAASR